MRNLELPPEAREALAAIEHLFSNQPDFTGLFKLAADAVEQMQRAMPDLVEQHSLMRGAMEHALEGMPDPRQLAELMDIALTPPALPDPTIDISSAMPMPRVHELLVTPTESVLEARVARLEANYARLKPEVDPWDLN